MKGQTNTTPEIFVQSAGKTQFRYNITQISIDEMGGGTRIAFAYDYIEIDGEITRAKLIDAVISEHYTKDAELALINNEIVSPGTSEYAEYQSFRVAVKTIIDGAL